MQSSKQEKVEKIYIDSNVWFSYFTKGEYDNDFEKVERLIDSIIKDQNKIAVISQLVILEMWNVLRNRIVQRAKFQGEIKKNKGLGNNLQSKITGMTKEFTDKITQWESSGKLIITPVNQTMTNFLIDAYKIHTKSFGYINDVYKCNVCKNEHYHGYKYKGVDHWDIQHALISKIANVNKFATFDKGYFVLKKQGHFDGIEVFKPE